MVMVKYYHQILRQNRKLQKTTEATAATEAAASVDTQATADAQEKIDTQETTDLTGPAEDTEEKNKKETSRNRKIPVCF